MEKFKFVFTVKNQCLANPKAGIEMTEVRSAPSLLDKLSYMFHPDMVERIVSSKASGKDRILTERGYDYSWLASHYRPDSSPVVYDSDILMVDFLYSAQEGCEDLRTLLESGRMPSSLGKTRPSTLREQYLRFWSDVGVILSEEFIAKFLHETRKHTLQGHEHDYLGQYKNLSLEQCYFIMEHDDVTDAVILFLDWRHSYEEFMDDILDAFVRLHEAPSVEAYERDFLKLDSSSWSTLTKREKLYNLRYAVHELTEQISRINHQIAWLEKAKFMGALPTDLAAWCGEELQQLCIDGNLLPISECGNAIHHLDAVSFSGIQLSESLQDDLDGYEKLSG